MKTIAQVISYQIDLGLSSIWLSCCHAGGSILILQHQSTVRTSRP